MPIAVTVAGVSEVETTEGVVMLFLGRDPNFRTAGKSLSTHIAGVFTQARAVFGRFSRNALMIFQIPRSKTTIVKHSPNVIK